MWHRCDAALATDQRDEPVQQALAVEHAARGLHVLKVVIEHLPISKAAAEKWMG